MWPSTSKLEKVAKDNGRIWTGSKARNLTKHEIIPSISRISGALLQHEALGPVTAAATHRRKVMKGGWRAWEVKPKWPLSP